MKEKRLRLDVVTLGRDVATVTLVYKVRGRDMTGRQTRTWIRFSRYRLEGRPCARLDDRGAAHFVEGGKPWRNKTPTLGNVIAPNSAWVAKLSEPALEPELPIVDPHHHLWQRTGNDYMFHDLLGRHADRPINIVGTVFVDCHSMYRKEGPSEMRCIGETEFAKTASRR